MIKKMVKEFDFWVVIVNWLFGVFGLGLLTYLAITRQMEAAYISWIYLTPFCFISGLLLFLTMHRVLRNKEEK